MSVRRGAGKEGAPAVLLCVSHSSELFGAERSLLDLVENLDRRRFVPVVAVPAEGSLKSRLDRCGIRTHVARMPVWVFRRSGPLSRPGRMAQAIALCLPSTLRLMGIMRREGVDIVYTNTITVFTGALAALLLGKPHVWHVREILREGKGCLTSFLPRKWLFYAVRKLSRAVVANSKATAGQFSGRGGPLVVYNGLDIERYRRLSAADTCGGSRWIVAVIGSLQRAKAQDVAIRAAELLKDRIPSIELHIIGKGDKDYEDYLKRLAAGLKMSDRVVFAGYKKDLRGILGSAMVVAVPSRLESFGRVAVEAMAAGVPVIASAVDGLKEVVVDGHNGFLVPPDSPERLAERILRLHDDPRLYEEMRENAREWARTRFDVKEYVARMESVLSHLV